MAVRTDLKMGVAIFFILCAMLVFWHIQANNLFIVGDDAFISYRYAQNIGQGNGPVFNPGERIWGYTSPAETFLLGLLSLIGADMQDAGTAVSLFFLAFSAWMVFLLFSRFFHPIYAFLVALHHMVNATGIYAFLGLETCMLICTQLVFLYLVLEYRYCAACFMAAVACLTRPDALVFVLPVLLLVPECRRLKNIKYFCIPGLVWLVFAYCYYGDIFPHSLYAKKQFVSFLDYIQINLPEVISYQNPFVSGFGLVAFTVLCVCLNLYSVLMMRTKNNAPLLFSFCVFPWLLVLCYAVIGTPPQHFWHVYSAKFFFWLGIAAGVGILVCSVTTRLKIRKLPQQAAFVGGGLLLLYFLLLVVPAVPQLLRYLEKQDTDFWFGARYKTYKNIALWLNSNLPADATVLLHEVGTIGFHTGLSIIDINGLVTNVIFENRKMTDGEIVHRYRPDYILLPGRKKTFSVEPLRSGDDTLLYTPVTYFPRKTKFYDFTLFAYSVQQ